MDRHDDALQRPQGAVRGTFDVAVIGAGPGGSAAAIPLARAGVHVALLDRARFPRDKMCGDGLTVDAQRALDELGVAERIAARAHRLPRARVLSPDATAIEVDGPFLSLRRRDLDMEMARQAVHLGAHFGCARVVALSDCGTHVQIECDGAVPLSAAIVIDASGAASHLSRASGLMDRRKPSAVALRGYVASRAALDVFHARFDRAVAPGYAWVFPLGDGVFNVGVIAYRGAGRSRGRTVTQRLQGFLAADPTARAVMHEGRWLERPHAAPVSSGFAGVRALARGRVFGVGDAVAAGYPMMAAGIGAALESGCLAAHAAVEALRDGKHLDAARDAFTAHMHARFDGLHRGLAIAERWLSRPWVAERLARRVVASARLQRGLARIVRLEQPAEELFTWRAALRWLGR